MIAIIDYKINNLDSVKNALDKLGIPAVVTSNKTEIQNATALILPGVGAAGEGMKNLKKNKLDRVIIEEVKKGKPILGICLGMQLLMEKSEEGNADCLGLIAGKVKKFNSGMKVPQIGWNEVKISNSKFSVFDEISDKSLFYFVHSYFCVPKDKELTVGITEYGSKYCSIFTKDNIVGVQFHPEKSGKVGFQVLKNFYKFYNNYAN
ncbi:imidazole glycerol phosphate synthase, glutamine amidotransferase subunit [Candidatus Roizmanbacteria bacterium RIFCSPLOWO2_01_FULL_38_12]|uniref:Imidazole glycerol phosphate synthase subunit HisH n=1 Tax=Candidatus Roizmanbacteria bacterium RIFCSPLOWO2_01_FULL_38_12 TaxID=1802061 RepID=A0A1F7IW93_9BACT|nr:MAG: imidazole glycerol phosphate synthase, glutamine amidotransferase subunit [Candidatus Roizmanbacteria bacterium RIFCSPHIGHO2_12_FULL_38_13]OGK47649.1 MAG: imidazole glycerol phosphate synthase, glutamine amidotransferase subunit [Candidatus Roizmanbacteria bacterium RIFCSPLOWO2_01_FULL_38_12]